MNTITILNRVIIDQPIMEELRLLSRTNLEQFIQVYIDFMLNNHCMYTGTHDLSQLTYYIDKDYMGETYLYDENGNNTITVDIEAEGTSAIYTYKGYVITFENTEKYVKGEGVSIVCCLMEIRDDVKIIHIEEPINQTYN